MNKLTALRHALNAFDFSIKTMKQHRVTNRQYREEIKAIEEAAEVIEGMVEKREGKNGD